MGYKLNLLYICHLEVVQYIGTSSSKTLLNKVVVSSRIVNSIIFSSLKLGSNSVHNVEIFLKAVVNSVNIVTMMYLNRSQHMI